MNIDFTTIRALSSRSRVTILEELMQEGQTPSSLSDRLDASTADITVQLETLANAGLVQQQPGEGFNTVYAPTEKAHSIIENGSIQANFSIGASGLAALLGAGIIGQASGILGDLLGTTTAASGPARSAPSSGTMMPDSGGATVPETTQAAGIDPVWIAIGLVLFGLSGFLMHYGRNIRDLLHQ